MTPVSLGDTVYLHVGTSSATTGAATNADSTPTITVEEDGAALGYAPTVANVATGLYRVTIDCTGGNGFEAGRRYSVYVAATVGGITGRDGIGEYEVLAVDLNTALDVAISTRLATAGYTAPDNASITTILSDTNDIQTRLPAALVGGRMASNAEVVGDKTGYSLTQLFPANFASMVITAGGVVDADVEAWLGSAPNALIAGRVDANAQVVGDKSGYSLTQAFPANFAALSITAGGLVDITQAAADKAWSTATRALTEFTFDVGLEVAEYAAIANALLDLADAIETGLTPRQALRVMASALAGKVSGAAGTTVTFRNAEADSKDRIVATVDSDGNRTAVTLDVT